MSPTRSPSWIADGEKYALVGLSVKTEGHFLSGPINGSLSAIVDTAFAMPDHWREWIGSIRSEELANCNLFLLSKMQSSTPEVLDAENNTLVQRVWNFYTGLLLSSPFATVHRPVVLTGARRDGEIDIRQQQDLDSPIPCQFRPYPSIRADDIQLAAQIGMNLGVIATTPPAGGAWRLFRTLHVYVEARTVPDILDRLHQYSRCIDGLILPAAGETKRQFKSRTQLFIGPRHHDMMGEIYDVRSAVEHLHENRYLEGFDRATRLDLLKKEAVAEYVARATLARILLDSSLWPHFANTTALGAFWALPDVDRCRIWGGPINPFDALTDFNPAMIHDGHLGGP